MKDEQIVALFLERNEEAIGLAQEVYGAYCGSIARNILGNGEDAEECVNDTWLRAWNAILPQRPRRMGAFLGKITRNLAIDRLKRIRAHKRGGGEVELLLSELAQCLGGGVDTEEIIMARDLEEAMNRFVRSLPRREGDVFLRRYFFAEPLSEIAGRYAMSTNAVAVSLSRTRKRLQLFLEMEGYL